MVPGIGSVILFSVFYISTVLQMDERMNLPSEVAWSGLFFFLETEKIDFFANYFENIQICSKSFLPKSAELRQKMTWSEQNKNKTNKQTKILQKKMQNLTWLSP